MKIFSVGPISTRRPGLPVSSRLKKAVMSLARAACCMLWVTIAIVYLLFSSPIRSSIARVATGSRAEQGSSISSTSGSTAIARAMQSRCCWPPERPEPGLSRRSLTSSQRWAPRSERSTTPSFSDLLDAAGVEVEPGGDVVVDRHRRERVRLLEDHPDQAADLDRVDPGAVDVLAVEGDLALDAGPRGQLVHAVERAQEGRLAAAGGADQRRHLVRLDRHRHVFDRLEVAVEEVDRRAPRSSSRRGRRHWSRGSVEVAGRRVAIVSLAAPRWPRPVWFCGSQHGSRFLSSTD